MKDIIGYSAGIIGASMMIPQVYRVIKTNSTDDLSIYSILLTILCSILWLWYGIIITDYPIIITDLALIIQETIILGYIIKHSFFSLNVSEE